MVRLKDIRGVWTATTTPFHADFSLDVEGAARNAAALAAEDANAFLVGGSIGEHVALDEEEWSTSTRSVIEALEGRVPVVVAVGHTDLRVVRARISRAMDWGADGVMVLPPYYFPLSGDELLDFYQVVSGCGAPFMTYSNPTTGGSTIGVRELTRIAAMPHYGGHKEATPNPVEFARKRKALGPDLPLIAAAETQVAYALLAGADGILTLTTTFGPDFMARMWNAASSGDFGKVRQLALDLMEFRALVDRINAEGSPAYLPVAKAALDLRGLAGGPPRSPVRPLSNADRPTLAGLMADKLRLGAASSPAGW